MRGPSNELRIGARSVGAREKCYLIAEIGLAHDGSLGNAHALLEAAANAGADAVKFQTHLPRYESTLEEPFRVNFSRQDPTRFDYWERTAFTEDQWAGLAAHAKDLGVAFLSSPFSVAAVELLRRVGVDAWKIGSGEFFSEDIHHALLGDDLPVLLSTGMATWEEIRERLDFFSKKNKPVGLFQCTTKYPTAAEDVGLNILAEMISEFGCPIGLSDHSGTIFPPLAAITLGASIIETHIVYDKRMFGPDSVASLTLDQFAQLAEGRDWCHAMRTHPVAKDSFATELSHLRAIFTKSVGYADDLPAGTVLGEQHFTARKPSTGIPYSRRLDLIGRKLCRDVSWKKLMRWEDIEGGEQG